MKEHDWKIIPTRIIKSEMGKRDISVKDLIKGLQKQGLNETTASINNKFFRSSFSAGFFLACLKAMDIKKFSLEDDYFFN